MKPLSIPALAGFVLAVTALVKVAMLGNSFSHITRPALDTA